MRIVSSKVKHVELPEEMLWYFHGALIELPKRMLLAKVFIEYHNDCVFVA